MRPTGRLHPPGWRAEVRWRDLDLDGALELLGFDPRPGASGPDPSSGSTSPPTSPSDSDSSRRGGWRWSVSGPLNVTFPVQRPDGDCAVL